MLFLGLGTGLGSALVSEGLVQPMELGHLPYARGPSRTTSATGALERKGKKALAAGSRRRRGRAHRGTRAEYVVLGGGNAKELKELPPGWPLGDNANAFTGGFRVWAADAPARILG